MLILSSDINFQTPYSICLYMASLIPPGTKTILEPTPGIGNIVTAVSQEHPDVNITAPQDFFLLDNQRFDCVIMNPPFSAKYADLTYASEEDRKSGMRIGYLILTKCMTMSDNVIALMPWFTLSDSDKRLKELVKFGLKSITPLPRKTFRYARIQTMVIVLKKGHKATEFNPIFHQ